MYECRWSRIVRGMGDTVEYFSELYFIIVIKTDLCGHNKIHTEEKFFYWSQRKEKAGNRCTYT